jgi:hypothetical protein
MPFRRSLGDGLRVLAALAAASAAAAEESPAWSIVVDPGDVDRSNLPVRVPLDVPQALAEAGIRIVLADGSQIDGQFVEPGLFAAARGSGKTACVPRDLMFVLPRLPAGAVVEVTAELAPAAAEPKPARLSWTDEPESAGLLLGGKPLVRYEKPSYDTADEAGRVRTYKPFHHVFDPATGIRLTKGDGGQYTHHRGIFFGYNRIAHGADKATTSDCWLCSGQARQEHRETLVESAGPVAGVQRITIDWIGCAGEAVLAETRELAVVPVAGGTVIDFASRLEAPAPVSLDGDPQHAGVHFRASNEVHEATRSQTYYLRPEGKAKPGEYRNWPQDKTYVNAPWHAASFVVGGQRYTALRVNRPQNPGEARMSERDYARFGSYFAHDLEPGEPLEVGYRFWIQPGELSVDEAARIAADYARRIHVTVRRAEPAAK